MNRICLHLAVFLCAVVCRADDAAAPRKLPADVIALLEDDADGLLKNLTNPTGDPGQGFVENNEVFSGKASIKIIPMQRFSPRIPGWGHRIVENPKPGEYRYLRFAWKADGGRGIMLQFHDDKDWTMRLTAGIDMYGWGTNFVAKEPPTKWTVVTRDLFKEFGEHTVRGIALTCFDGKAGYFDHIYFSRTLEDLDRIDATGLGAVKLDQAKLGELWRDLAGADEAKAYLAFWTMVAGSEQAAPFIKEALKWGDKPEALMKVKRWIADLDADAFAAREAAQKNLADNLGLAADLLRKELAETASPEVRQRIENLLATHKEDDAQLRRIERANRVLEYTKKG